MKWDLCAGCLCALFLLLWLLFTIPAHQQLRAVPGPNEPLPIPLPFAVLPDGVRARA